MPEQPLETGKGEQEKNYYTLAKEKTFGFIANK